MFTPVDLSDCWGILYPILPLPQVSSSSTAEYRTPSSLSFSRNGGGYASDAQSKPVRAARLIQGAERTAARLSQPLRSARGASRLLPRPRPHPVLKGGRSKSLPGPAAGGVQALHRLECPCAYCPRRTSLLHPSYPQANAVPIHSGGQHRVRSTITVGLEDPAPSLFGAIALSFAFSATLGAMRRPLGRPSSAAGALVKPPPPTGHRRRFPQRSCAPAWADGSALPVGRPRPRECQAGPSRSGSAGRPA